MRNTREENVSEHSLEVAVIAHALAIIQKKRLNKKIDTEKTVLYAVYHDVSEIFTGDLPTPVKYFNPSIKDAYKTVEISASRRLLSLLPEDLYDEYEPALIPKDDEKEIWQTIKAADKLSAYIKCLEEEKSGNNEFVKAEQSILNELKNMKREDVKIFLEEFIEGYSLTLDEM